MNAESCAGVDASDCLRVRYAAGELICRVGTYAAGLHWIIDGVVLETTNHDSQQGRPACSEVLMAGDIIGLEVLLPCPQELYTGSCHALSDVELVFAERKAVLAAMSEDAPFSRALSGYLATRVFSLRRAVHQRSLPAREHVHALLSSLAERMGAHPGVVTLPREIDLRVLGELSGRTPTAVRRAMAGIPGVREVDRGIQVRTGGSGIDGVA